MSFYVSLLTTTTTSAILGSTGIEVARGFLFFTLHTGEISIRPFTPPRSSGVTLPRGTVPPRPDLRTPGGPPELVVVRPTGTTGEKTPGDPDALQDPWVPVDGYRSVAGLLGPSGRFKVQVTLESHSNKPLFKKRLQ